MKASLELIGALRRAADRIEDPNGGYNWFTSVSCNCGILAQEVLGRCVSGMGCWRFAAEDYRCVSTRAPMRAVFADLIEAGLEVNDFHDIELTCNAVVAKRAGIQLLSGIPRGCTYKEPDVVALYFKAQADILEEELAARPSPSKPVAQPCVHMWLECGVCMLCSATKPVERKELVS